MSTNRCGAERVAGAPMLGTCSKPQGHDGEHYDEKSRAEWTVSL